MNRGERQSRPVVRLYAAAVLLSALIALGNQWLQWTNAWPEPLATIAGPMSTALFWLMLTLAAEAFWFAPRAGLGMVSMSLGVNLASILVLPAQYALPIAGISVVFADLVLHRRCLLRATFNAAQTTLALAGAAWVLHETTSNIPPVGSLLLDPRPALFSFMVFFVINTGLVAGVLALESRENLFLIWQRCFITTQQGLSTLAHFILAVALARSCFDLGFMSGLAAVLFFALIREALHGRLAKPVEQPLAS